MPHEIDVTAGRLLREQRLARGMSQVTLAEACGVSFQQIQKYENGTNRISVSRLVQICKVLSCRPSDILSRIEDAQPAGEVTSSRLELEVIRACRQLPEEAVRYQVLSIAKALQPRYPIQQAAE